MKLAIGVAGLLMLVVLFMVSYLGMSTGARIYETDFGLRTFVFKHNVGPYREVRKRMQKMLFEFKDRYPNDGIEGFAIFYDMPGSMPRDKMRSIVGIMISGNTKITDDPLEGYSIAMYAECSFCAIDMKLEDDSSYMFNPVKAYPKLKTYMKEKNYEDRPVLEIYDLTSGKITYAAAISEVKGILKGHP